MIRKQKQSDADRLRQALNALHLTHAAFGDVVGRDERTIRRWVAGQNAIPKSVWLILESLTTGEIK